MSDPVRLERSNFVQIFLKQVLAPWDPHRNYLIRYAQALYFKHELACMHNPRTIVEIGVRAGYSMWAMLVGCPGAKYVGYDIWKPDESLSGESAVMQKKYFKRATHLANVLTAGRVIFRVKDTQVPKFEVPRADLYHIDGAHSPAACVIDLVHCIQSMRNKSIIVVHDYNEPNIRAVVNQTAGDYDLHLVPISSEWGDAVLTFNEPPLWVYDLHYRWREWWHPHSLGLIRMAMKNPDFLLDTMRDRESKPKSGQPTQVLKATTQVFETPKGDE